MFLYEILKLFIQPIPDFPGVSGEVELDRILNAVHHEHTVLDTPEIIFKGKV